MTDRNAIVTGGSSGIGRAIAVHLLATGWRVTINGLGGRDAGEAIAVQLGSNATYIDANVAHQVDAEAIVAHAAPGDAPVDLLVNCAGIARRVPHSDLSAVDDDLWDAIMSVNLKGPWNMARAAESRLRMRGGHIINISSLAGINATGSSIPYAVSKAGLIHMTRLLSKALGPAIRVNAIAPGYIDTPLTHGWDDVRATTVQSAPLRRLGEPDDVAAVVQGLIGMKYVTGVVIPVDGGLHVG